MVTLNTLWPWLSLAALGAFHGLNPAMGWLFAVALGLQERRLRAVTMALGPIALGHALAIGLVAVAVGMLAVVVYQKVGVEVLRRAWINLDLIWVGALAVTGGIALALGLWPGLIT